MVDTPNVKKHHFVLKTTVYPLDPILFFFSTYMGFLGHMSVFLPSPIWQNAKVFDSTQEEDIADWKYDSFANNIDFHINPQIVGKIYKAKNPEHVRNHIPS